MADRGRAADFENVGRAFPIQRIQLALALQKRPAIFSIREESTEEIQSFGVFSEEG